VNATPLHRHPVDLSPATIERYDTSKFRTGKKTFQPSSLGKQMLLARRLLEQLWEAGATVRAYDPEAMAEARRLYGDDARLHLCDEAYAALDSADALVIMTEWKAFWSPDFLHIAEMLRTPVIFDGRNIYEPVAVEQAGIAYYGIGRGRSVRAGTA